jgi:hypothetical protein
VFGELKKILDRNFIVGYFVPSAALLIITIILLQAYGIPVPKSLAIDWDLKLTEATLLGLVAWAGGLVLLAFNREIIRTMEGYWPRNWSFGLRDYQRWRFRRLCKKVATLDQAYRDFAAAKTGAAFRDEALRNRLKRKLAEAFPSTEDQVLPTAFGNTLRAFEDYPRVMYGLESIQGWSWLQGVMSKEFAETMNGAESTVNLWVNLFVVSLVVCVLSAVLGAQWSRLIDWTSPSTWHLWGKGVLVPAASLVCAVLAYGRARSAAERWGEWVKGAFDIYVPELCTKLGYDRPATIEEERTMWLNFSRGIIYRIPKWFDKMNDYRAKEPPAAQENSAANPADAKPNGEEADEDEEDEEGSDAGAGGGVPIRKLVPLLLLTVVSVEWLRSRLSGRV